MKYNLTTEDTEITEDTDRRWHSLREWSAQKNPRLFMRACSCSAFLHRPYPDESGLIAPIGESIVLRGIGVRKPKRSSKKNSVFKTGG